MRRHRLILISDLHCGSVTGVTPPQYQTESNRAWLGPFWERLQSAAAQLGTVDTLVANGDLIDGPGRKDSTKHITTDLLEQAEWAAETLSLFKARRRFVVRGTGYHTDSGGSIEDVVAKILDCPVSDELRLDHWGTLSHFRHVVGRSDVPYGQYTQAGKEMINDTLQAELEDYEAADLLGRSHVHYSTGAWRWNTSRGRRQEVFTNPALQLRGPSQSSYVRQLRTWMYHVGFTVIDYGDDGSWVVAPVIFPIQIYWQGAREYLCLESTPETP
jgi:hypothetical protein